MSYSLVRRGLDLYKTDITVKAEGSTKDRRDEIDLVGTNKQGYRKKLKRLQQKQSATTLKEKKIKPTEAIYEVYAKRDKTEANVKALNFMQLLNQDEQKTMAKVAEHHETKLKRKTKKHEKKESQTSKQSSAFTEEDFERFFKEYQFS